MPGRVPGILFAALYSAFQHGLGVQGHAVAADFQVEVGLLGGLKGDGCHHPQLLAHGHHVAGVHQKVFPHPAVVELVRAVLSV